MATKKGSKSAVSRTFVAATRRSVQEALSRPLGELDLAVLMLDGVCQLTTSDEFVYHEMMAHPALFTHANPKHVVIIGGGDCGTLREVLKHPGVVEAVQCDIDEQVTRMAEKWFPELCDSNADPRASLLFDDGIAYMANRAPGSVDIVIVDSTDPVGPAEGLFNKAFYASCFRALKDDGILVQQSESPLVQLDLIREMRGEMRKAGFRTFATLPFPQPCYPTGWWSCTLARKGDGFGFREGDADARGSDSSRNGAWSVHYLLASSVKSGVDPSATWVDDPALLSATGQGWSGPVVYFVELVVPVGGNWTPPFLDSLRLRWEERRGGER